MNITTYARGIWLRRAEPPLRVAILLVLASLAMGWLWAIAESAASDGGVVFSPFAPSVYLAVFDPRGISPVPFDGSGNYGRHLAALAVSALGAAWPTALVWRAAKRTSRPALICVLTAGLALGVSVALMRLTDAYQAPQRFWMPAETSNLAVAWSPMVLHGFANSIRTWTVDDWSRVYGLGLTVGVAAIIAALPLTWAAQGRKLGWWLLVLFVPPLALEEGEYYSRLPHPPPSHVEVAMNVNGTAESAPLRRKADYEKLAASLPRLRGLERADACVLHRPSTNVAIVDAPLAPPPATCAGKQMVLAILCRKCVPSHRTMGTPLTTPDVVLLNALDVGNELQRRGGRYLTIIPWERHLLSKTVTLQLDEQQHAQIAYCVTDESFGMSVEAFHAWCAEHAARPLQYRKLH